MRREIQDTSPSMLKDGNENPDDGIGFRIHVSGSAYKIVNRRAYHHGTMLISSELGTLGKLLHSNKVSESLFLDLDLEF
jgi:hypothetical protein